MPDSYLQGGMSIARRSNDHFSAWHTFKLGWRRLGEYIQENPPRNLTTRIYVPGIEVLKKGVRGWRLPYVMWKHTPHPYEPPQCTHSRRNNVSYKRYSEPVIKDAFPMNLKVSICVYCGDVGEASLDEPSMGFFVNKLRRALSVPFA